MLILDAPTVKPEVVFMEELLEDINKGKLRVPRFQRPFFWKPSDMLSLLDSIYKGYPVGSLLLWESASTLLSLDEVGPLPVPSAPTTSVTYILDGHQRLATLFGSLMLPNSFPKGPKQQEWRWWIWFDLKKKIFTHVPKGEPEPWFLPLRAILKTMDFLTVAKEIQQRCPDDAACLIEEAENLAQQVKSFKVAITRIQGGGLSQAVEIFSRLNTRGLPMTPDQMVSALTYREGEQKIDLAQRIDEILESLAQYHFGGIKRLTVFRAIVAAGRMDIHTSDWEILAKRLGKDLVQSIEDAESSLLAAARFLYEDLHVLGDKLLPYSHQLVFLSEFFNHCPEPNDTQIRILTRWFWGTSLTGWFAGANSTQINEALKEMRLLAKIPAHEIRVMSVNDPARPFPQRFDMRSARIRAFLMFMMTLKPVDPRTGETVAPERLFGEQGLPYIFPRAEGSLVSSPANRILFEREAGKSAKQQLRAIERNVRDRVLASHGITSSAYASLERDDAPGFIRDRIEHLSELERKFIEELGLTPPRELSTAEPDIDSDED